MIEMGQLQLVRFLYQPLRLQTHVGVNEAREIEELKAEINNLSAVWDNEYALGQSIHNAYIEVAKNQVSERLIRAEFVQKTAAAISGVYVAVLGLTYSIADNAPLPGRGILPGIFLGLSIFLSAVYGAYLTESGEMEGPKSNGNLGTLQPARLNSFIMWTIYPVLKRKYMLQGAVTSLGVGVLLLPLPYLAIPDMFSFVAFVAGILITLLLPLILERVGQER